MSASERSALLIAARGEGRGVKTQRVVVHKYGYRGAMNTEDLRRAEKFG